MPSGERPLDLGVWPSDLWPSDLWASDDGAQRLHYSGAGPALAQGREFGEKPCWVMQSFCFVHAADLHLDTPFVGVRGEAPEVAASLRDASLEAWDALVELTLERSAAFLLLAGDLYDGAERGLRAQLRFHAGLAKLSRAGVRVLAVHGNHDPCDEGWSAVAKWPAGVEFFSSRAVQTVRIERAGECIATVHGVSYPRREMYENLALGFERGPQAGFHIGLLHCSVEGASRVGRYSPCALGDLVAAGMDYWALGHIHRHSVLASDAPWVVYPGCLQGRSFKPSERGAKGAVVVQVEGAAVVELEHVAIDRVRFEEARVDVSECRDFLALEASLLDASQRLRKQNPDRALIVRGQLEGRSSMAAALQRDDVLGELLAALRDSARVHRPFMWWESLHSEVRSELDREQLRSRGDFVSELVQLSDRLSADSAGIQALLARESGEEAGRWFELALGESAGESEASASVGAPPAEASAELHAVLREGEELALSLLEGDPAQAKRSRGGAQ